MTTECGYAVENCDDWKKTGKIIGKEYYDIKVTTENQNRKCDNMAKEKKGKLIIDKKEAQIIMGNMKIRWQILFIMSAAVKPQHCLIMP